MDPGQQFLPIDVPRAARKSTTRVAVGVHIPIPGTMDRVPWRYELNDKHPVDFYHGGTYPMLMTGHEIRHEYQGWDNDRKSISDKVTKVDPARPATHKTNRWATPGNPKIYRTYNTGEMLPENVTHDQINERRENDDEMFARKYREADQEGLVASITEHGFNPKNPISLAHGEDPQARGGAAETGRHNQWQILGGHHRVAVMSRQFPDQLIPVSFHSSISQARSTNPGY